MTVQQLMDTMSSSEFNEWVALYKIEASEREQAQQRAKSRK
jgi:hypothetical protein